MKNILIITIAILIFYWGTGDSSAWRVNVNINPAPGQEAEVKPEKPLVIKGLSIGMDINKARTIMINILGSGWKVTPVGAKDKIMADYRFGDSEIFGSSIEGYFMNSIIGDMGFAIIDSYDHYCGFVSADPDKNTVTRISINRKITDHIFSSAGIYVDAFVDALRNNYNMPGFPWIPHGWRYHSPHGYVLRIMTNKLIDIQKMDFAGTGGSGGGSSAPGKIQFE